jgi:hypothetical protein
MEFPAISRDGYYFAMRIYIYYHFHLELRPVHTKPFFLLISACCCLPGHAVDLDKYPIKALYLPAAYLLADHFIKRHPEASIGNLLERAKKAGYTHLIVNFDPQVWTENPSSGDEHAFYKHARWTGAWPLGWPDGRYHLYKEVFETAATAGFIIIPHIEVWTNRCGRAIYPTVGWDDLHPAAIDGKKNDIDSLPSAIVLNRYNGFASTPLADDGPQGFIEHLREFYRTLKEEYDAADPRPPAIPAVYLSFDEPQAPAVDPETGGEWVTHPRGKPYHHLVLLLGQDNPYDQAFLQKVIDRETAGGKPVERAVKTAIATLYAYRIEEELREIRQVFGPATNLMIGGYLFDPQAGGGESFVTAYHPKTRFVPAVDSNNVPDIRGNIRVLLSGGDSCDVLDLPGVKDPAIVRNGVIVVPYWYFTYRNLLRDGTQKNYEPALTFDFLKKKGFSFVFMSTLTSFGDETSPTALTVDAMKNNLIALGSTQYNGMAKGFVAAWWPCMGHLHGRPGSHAPGDSSCRCGAFNYNMNWHDDKDAYDQPFEYNTLEYLMWYARGKTSRPPPPGSKGFMTWLKALFAR